LKESIRRLIGVISSITVGIFLISVCWYSVFFLMNAGSMDKSLLDLEVMVDGAADARIYTWVDLNENGVVDNDEPPLPYVRIDYPFSYLQRTDDFGNASASNFKPGCESECWVDEYVEVITPEGYRATTPVRVEMTGDNLLYCFGFVKLAP